MKKLKFSFLILFILTTLSANAQFSFGVKGGLNVSNIRGSFYGNDVKNSVKLGYNVGVIADYMFNENMGIQSGLLFTTAGARITITPFPTGVSVGPIEDVRGIINFQALQIPLHFAYKIKLTDKYKITLHGGPYAAYFLSGKETGSYSKDEKTNSRDLYGKNYNIKRFDAGLGFGVALGYGNCFFDLGYDMGLTDLLEFNKERKKTMKTMNIYLSVGYKF